MKNLLLFLSFVFLINMKSEGQAPCPTVKDPHFIRYGFAGNICFDNFSVLVINDQPGAINRSVFIQIKYKSGANIIGACFTLGTTPGGEIKTFWPFYLKICDQAAEAVITIFNNTSCTGLICNEIHLPLVIISFSGKKVANGNQLDWSIVKEMVEDGEFFTVEKSKNGNNFSPITNIPANNQTSDYSYTDRMVSEKNFYRLVLNNKNDKKYSNTIIIERENTGSRILITNEQIHFSQLNGSEVFIVNITGQIVKRFKVAGENTAKLLSELNLIPGMYVVTAVRQNDIPITEKFVKQ